MSRYQRNNRTEAAPRRQVTKVETGWFKGNRTITLPDPQAPEYPFTFGVRKAEIILAHVEEIRRFVETEAKATKAADEARGLGDRFDAEVEDSMARRAGVLHESFRS